MRRTIQVAICAIAVLAAAYGSYSVIRHTRGADPNPLAASQPNEQSAQPSPTPSGISPPVPTIPSGLPLDPDVRRPFWADPYRADDERKPRFIGTLNGIRVGPTTVVESSLGAICIGGTTQELSLEDAVDTPLMIRPMYLPSGSTTPKSSSLRCRTNSGETVIFAAQLSFFVPGLPSSNPPRFGGSVRIVRWIGDPVVELDAPVDRVSAGSIRGRNGIVVRPILPNGLGDSAIILYENGIVTFIQIQGSLTLGEVRRIAEGLY